MLRAALNVGRIRLLAGSEALDVDPLVEAEEDVALQAVDGIAGVLEAVELDEEVGAVPKPWDSTKRASSADHNEAVGGDSVWPTSVCTKQ